MLENILKTNDEKIEKKEIELSWPDNFEGTGKEMEEELSKIWMERYRDNPKGFFVLENLKSLESLTLNQRLALLTQTAGSLLPSLEDFQFYFQKFPQDLKAINIYCSSSKGRPNNVSMWQLWAATQPLLKDCQCKWTDEGEYSYPYGDFEQISAIALRRQYATDCLMPDYSDLNVSVFSKYGGAANGIHNLLNESRKPNWNKKDHLKPKQIINPEFQKLSKQDQAAFLRQALACFHHDRVWEEVYNSGFLPSTVKMLSRKSTPCHSVLFKSEYNNSFYKNEGLFLFNMNSTEDRGGFLEEYGNERVLLFLIDELGKAEGEDVEKNINYLLTFWKKNRNPLFGGAISRSLSALNPEKSADILLKMLKEEKGNKNYLSAMLYRLEFGRLNISNEGVNYLQKIYDLGELNNPNFHVSRLTVSGNMGIFNEELELIKYFNLESPDDERKKIIAKVLDFTYKTLFIGQKEESLENKAIREKYLTDFKKNYYKIASDKIFSETGVQLNNLSFKEQGWFIIAFDKANEKEKELMREFVKKNREEGIKSFLALEVDPDLKEKILKIGLELPEEASRPIFFKLEEIINLVNLKTDELNKYFIDTESNYIDWREVKNLMLNSIKGILIDFSSFSEEKEKIDQTLFKLNKVKTDIILLSSLLKSAKKHNQNLDLNIIKELNLSIKKYGEELPENDREAILSIAGDNWKSFGNDKMAQVVIDDLKTTLDESTNQKTYTLKYKDEIIGFVRFEDKGKNVVHVGSLNVSKDIRGLSIGKELMENALIAESNENILEATASVKIPAGCSYVEKIGFVADGLIYDYKDTGESLFSIKLDKKRNLNYKLRNEGKEEKISQEELKEMLNDYNELDSLIGQEIIVLSFDLNKEMTEYQEALKTLLPEVNDNLELHEKLKNKYTLTRYFYDKKNDPKGNKRYLVFEKNN